MLFIQGLLVIFFVFAIVKVIARYRSGDLTGKVMIFWIIFWLLAGTAVILPNTTFYLARIFGVTRGADAVVYVGLALVFYLVFRLMARQEKINRDITVIVRQLALKDIDKK